MFFDRVAKLDEEAAMFMYLEYLLLSPSQDDSTEVIQKAQTVIKSFTNIDRLGEKLEAILDKVRVFPQAMLYYQHLFRNDAGYLF